MIRPALVIALWLVGAVAAGAASLAVTTSTERIEITSNFTGGAVTVFGAVEEAGDIDPREMDIVVIIRGPNESVIARRKERTFGLWLNRAETVFTDIASYYAVDSTRPLSDITEPAILDALRLGVANQVSGDEGFTDAIIRLRREAGLFAEETDVERVGDTAFRTAFTLPADVSDGDFMVEVFLFQGGRVLDYATHALVISKSGAEEFIHEASLAQPWLYAFAVIAIAVGAGWIGGIIFRRD